MTSSNDFIRSVPRVELYHESQTMLGYLTQMQTSFRWGVGQMCEEFGEAFVISGMIWQSAMQKLSTPPKKTQDAKKKTEKKNKKEDTWTIEPNYLDLRLISKCGITVVACSVCTVYVLHPAAFIAILGKATFTAKAMFLINISGVLVGYSGTHLAHQHYSEVENSQGAEATLVGQHAVGIFLGASLLVPLADVTFHFPLARFLLYGDIFALNLGCYSFARILQNRRDKHIKRARVLAYQALPEPQDEYPHGLHCAKLMCSSLSFASIWWILVIPYKIIF